MLTVFSLERIFCSLNIICIRFLKLIYSKPKVFVFNSKLKLLVKIENQ